MTIYIKITKVLEKKNIGFYHVFTKHVEKLSFMLDLIKNIVKYIVF